MDCDGAGEVIRGTAYQFRSQKPSRPSSVRAKLDLQRNIFMPILGFSQCHPRPTLFGVYINHDDRKVEFFDSYDTSDASRRAREAYVCDSVSLSTDGSNTGVIPNAILVLV